MTSQKKAENFLNTAAQFQLGLLPTEQSHPLTTQLSTLAQKNLNQALKTLREVDRQALSQMRDFLPLLIPLRTSIQKALQSGKRIFLCGCGATGRLSLSLEFLWRQKYPESQQVISFMAGGDIALVHSIEGFEDFPEYGKRQLEDLGFQDGDLLIASTEGGETPFVIGATMAASKISSHSPFFLYCNPNSILQKIQRSQKVLQDQHIEKICLSIGPMALAGSTRMQASTILQWAIGLALFYTEAEASQQVSNFLKHFESFEEILWVPFVEKESEVYQREGRVCYEADSELAICVFTDTTERSPTFSLKAFSPLDESFQPLSLSYLTLRGTRTHREAWEKLLNHSPRQLNWGDIKLSEGYLYDFDFSYPAQEKRKSLVKEQILFSIYLESKESGNIKFQFEELNLVVQAGQDLFQQHLFLKLILNMHSTLVMGRMNRYKDNLMTWVLPSNGKLVDRAARYVRELLTHQNISMSYEEVIYALFEEMEKLKPTESIVLKTLTHCIEKLSKRVSPNGHL